MAARENQGLHIALIVFAVLTITLIVTSYMFFRKYEEELDKEKASANKAQDAVKAQASAETETLELKKILGVGPRDSLKTVQDNFKEDMEKFGPNFKESEQHYRQLVKHWYSKSLDSDARFADAKRREEELKAQIAAGEKVKVTEIAQYDVNLKKSVADLKSEQDSFRQARGEFTKSGTELAGKLEAKNREVNESTKKLNETIAARENEIVVKQKLIKELEGHIVRNAPLAELPSGKITWVNQRERVVWLNIGSSDGLRRQTTFKILAPDETNMHSEGKGKVEVTRLLGDHMAEARVVDDKLSNPIMPGDQIFSQVWVPGRVEHFALVGFMDIDGNGESDRARVKSLISLNGGIVDAELTDEGKRVGEMTVNTTYLVLGATPTDKGSAEFLKAYSEMRNSAEALGVKTMSMEDFLNNMGYQSGDTSVAMDGGPGTEDIKVRRKEGVVRKANGFKPRRPSAPKPSAY